jgi:hypothetical protein
MYVVIRPRAGGGGCEPSRFEAHDSRGKNKYKYGPKYGVYEKISGLQRRQTRTTTCTASASANNRNKADAVLEPRRYHHSQPYDQSRP